MTELLKTRFFALLAGESQEEITKESLEEELGKFVEEVAGLCDTGEDYLSTCRALNYTKTRLQALLEMYKDCDGVYWKTENVLTKVMELLIGFEALEEFYSPTGKLLEFCELVAIAEQVLGIQIKNYRQLKSRVLKRYKEETVLDQLERLIEKLRVQVYK